MCNDIVQKCLTCARKLNEGLGLNHRSDIKSSINVRVCLLFQGPRTKKLVLNFPEMFVYEQNELIVKESLCVLAGKH